MTDSTTTEASDRALLQTLEKGDPEAAGALFERYYDELFAFSNRLLGNPHGAADAVQETFLRILRYAGSYSGRGTVRGWIFRITRNTCLDLVEARRRDLAARTELPRPAPSPPPAGPDPRIIRLRNALDALAPARREVLILRRFHDLTYAEIAEVCGITEGAARVRAHRALHQLRREMTPQPEDSSA